eukprot:s89_g6.t1
MSTLSAAAWEGSRVLPPQIAAPFRLDAHDAWPKRPKSGRVRDVEGFPSPLPRLRHGCHHRCTPTIRLGAQPRQGLLRVSVCRHVGTDNKRLLKLLTQENVLVGGFFAISGYVAAYTSTNLGERRPPYEQLLEDYRASRLSELQSSPGVVPFGSRDLEPTDMVSVVPHLRKRYPAYVRASSGGVAVQGWPPEVDGGVVRHVAAAEALLLPGMEILLLRASFGEDHTSAAQVHGVKPMADPNGKYSK